LAEELGITLDPQAIRYLYTVHGPAYGQAGEVELVCFAAQWQGTPRPQGEISEVQWINQQELHMFAPAVQILCSKFLQTAQTGAN